MGLRWFFRTDRESERAYDRALDSQRAIVADLTDRNQKLSEENGRLKATIERQFQDLRELAEKSVKPGPVAAADFPPSSPLLAVIPPRTGPVAVPDKGTPPKPLKPLSEPPRRGPFAHMAVSGGHIRATNGVKAIKDEAASK